MNNILEIKNLSFGYSRAEPIVNQLSLTMEPQKILCLLGPSGCGKTSLMRLIAGLETPTQGEIYLYGKPVFNRNHFVMPENREIGMLFQDYALFPHLNVANNIGFAASLSKDKKSQTIRKLLDMVDLLPFADHYPHMLSGGQQQRVALARAIASNPKLLLLDEPFSGLDTRLRDEIRDRTLHIIQETGIAAIMVTHDAEEAMYMADYIALMHNGSILQAGTPEQLYYQPKDIFTAQFLSNVNLFTLPIVTGKVHTPFGEFPAVFPDYTTVNLVIRPEALKLEKSRKQSLEQKNQMRVMASRLIGGESMVHLYCPTLEAQDVHLHARIPGRFLPKPDEIFDVTVDNEQLFIFPEN